MAPHADERMMISERIAPGMLPRVLNSMDMTIIFVAIVLFIVNASAIQRAGPAAYTYWILGFLAFLIPGALITAQLGLMFPQEGSLYVWTQKALGPFWGFFAGFCACGPESSSWRRLATRSSRSGSSSRPAGCRRTGNRAW
jgi:hypothetical protein